MKTCIVLLAVFLTGTRALWSSQENKIENYGKVTLVKNDDTNTYTLSAEGIPDHECTRGCGSDQSDTTYEAPTDPVQNDEGTCMPFGAIGMALNGVVFYNPYSSSYTPATDCETLDTCGGHPNGRSVYHYHGDPGCLNEDTSGMLGIAFDGHPIFRRLVSGSLPTAAELANVGITLDDCHGAVVNGQYRYFVTSDFPYVLGCFRGDPSDSVRTNGPNCQMADSSVTVNGCDAVTFSKRTLTGLQTSDVKNVAGSREGATQAEEGDDVRGRRRLELWSKLLDLLKKQ